MCDVRVCVCLSLCLRVRQNLRESSKVDRFFQRQKSAVVLYLGHFTAFCLAMAALTDLFSRFSSPESFASLSVVPPSNVFQPSANTNCQVFFLYVYKSDKIESVQKLQLPRVQLGRESLANVARRKEEVAKNWIVSYIARFLQQAGGCKRKTGKVHKLTLRTRITVHIIMHFPMSVMTSFRSE